MSLSFGSGKLKYSKSVILPFLLTGKRKSIEESSNLNKQKNSMQLWEYTNNVINDNPNPPPLKKKKISNSLNSFSSPFLIHSKDNNNDFKDSNGSFRNVRKNKEGNSFPSLVCVDCIENITFSISFENKVYSCGHSTRGAHGHENSYIFPLKRIQDLSNIKMISCGDYHSICLDYNGIVFSFGCNNYGQLGIGKTSNELKQTHIPQKINLPLCKRVSCGAHFTMCLTEDNQLFSFGENYKGQLGLGNYNYYNSPQLIPDLNDIEYIDCSGNYSICKTYNNEFYSWGDNTYGQLGQGNNKSCNKPIQCLDWPDDIISIKCGIDYSLLLTSKGYLYSFGNNYFGQLGINDKSIESINIPTLILDIPEIQRIECGNDHSICIDINNNLWIFGDNECGQLGIGDKEIRYKPILHPTLSNVIDISPGGDHTFVRTIDNKIYAFGNNEHSQLGIKTQKRKQLTPIQVFKDNDDIWRSFIGKSKQKSARK